MAWIRNNSELNPKVTALPALTNYTEGSVTVITAPYGDVEYIVKNNTWVPNRALTDLNINVSSSGSNAINRGSEALPFQTLQYALSIIPKKIKNLNIYLFDINEEGLHDAYGVFQNLEKTNPSDKITINGRTYGPMESTLFVNGSSKCFNDLFRKISTNDLFEFSTYTKTILTVTNYGTEAGTGLHYVEVDNYNFKENGFYVGQVVYNDNNVAPAQIVKIEYNDTIGRLYLTETIFGVIGQTLAGIFTSSEMKFMECVNSVNPEKIGMLWPVYAMGYNFVILPETPSYILQIGDEVEGVRLTLGTFVFDNVNLDINIKRINNDAYSNGLEFIYTSFKNCDSLVDLSQSNIKSLTSINSPNITFSKTVLKGYWYLERCFSNNPIYINFDTFETDDNKDINNETYMNSNLNGNILIASSIVSVEEIIFNKSSVSVKNSVFTGREKEEVDLSLLTLEDSYLQLDSSSAIVCVDTEVPAIDIKNNSTLDMSETNKVDLYDVENFVNISTISGVYREKNFKVYETRAQMLGDVLVPNGIVGSVIEEPGNIYLRQSNKWVVMSGNRYTTVLMPTTVDFTLPDGLEIFDLTLNREVTWRN